MADRQTQAERWLDEIGMDDGLIYEVGLADGDAVSIIHLLDGTVEVEGWTEDVLALVPDETVRATTVYVGDERTPQDAYLWPDGSGILDLGAWWDLVDMSREDPRHRSESGEPIYGDRGDIDRPDHCSYCGRSSHVLETRESPHGLRRRRACGETRDADGCGHRWTTYERPADPPTEEGADE